MTATDSRLKEGTLTLGTDPHTLDVSCQPSNITITPAHESDGDPLEVLCGTVLPAPKRRSDTLAITAVQDFDKPDGFIAYTWAHDLEQVQFTWSPNKTGMIYSGVVEVLALQVGGDVGARLTTEAEWAIVGPVRVTYPQPPAAGAEPADDLEAAGQAVTPA